MVIIVVLDQDIWSFVPGILFRLWFRPIKLKDSVLCNQLPSWIQRAIYTIGQPGKHALYILYRLWTRYFEAVAFPLVFLCPSCWTPFLSPLFYHSPGVIRAHRPYVFCVASIGASVPRAHMWQQQTLGFSWVVGDSVLWACTVHD